MRYVGFLLCGLTLASCGVGLGLTPEAADAVVTETMAKLTPVVADVFARHELPVDAAAQFLKAVQTTLEGLLTGGVDWRSILGDVADFGFTALLAFFGIRAGAPRVGSMVAGLFGKKKAT